MAKQIRRKDDKGNVLEKGEGQRKNGSYFFEWKDGYGQRHYIYAATLQELREKKKDATFDLLTGVKFDKKNMTLNEALEFWKQSRESDIAIGALKPTTINQYLCAYNNHVRDSLGNLKIKDITKRKLEAFYKGKLADGLGISQIINIAKPINQTLAIAEDEDWIRRSPTKRALRVVSASAKQQSEEVAGSIKALTQEEQTVLLDWLSRHPDRFPLKCIVTLFLYTGLRIGELSGLQSYNVFESCLRVEHSFAYFSDVRDGDRRMVRAMQKPKTRAGRRTIPLLEPAKKAIQDYQEWVEDSGIKLVEPVDGFSDFIFLTRKGYPHTDAGINVALKRVIATINKEKELMGDPMRLPYISCHWLRRTFATRLCEAGVSLRVAQYLMGHKDINITANIYTAVQDGLATREMLKLKHQKNPVALPSNVFNLQQTYNKFAV